MKSEDIENIRTIVEAAVANGQSQDTPIEAYFFAVLVAAAASALGAFFGAYMKRKGENLATKEDFTNLLEQTKETTTVTERIKEHIAAQSKLKAKGQDVARQIYANLLDVSTDLNRLKSGLEVSGLMNGHDIVPLTEVFKQIEANKNLVGSELYSILRDLGNNLIEFANVAHDDKQTLATVTEKYLELQQKFNRQLIKSFESDGLANEDNS
ncbi:MAG: hypothetical protein DBO99_02800 [gamma proteobacterium symbiont of Ctena orbiculata]|nr:MAG: hypothetical protein DBO99_02800 [gamma proteobacterium symbiont of Ctena orbiculata]